MKVNAKYILSLDMHSPEKLKGLEQLLKNEELNDKLKQWFGVELVRCYQYQHKYDKALALYPTLLQRATKNPEEYYGFSTLWMYKWMIDNLCDISYFSKDIIENAVNDFEKYVLQMGYGQAVVYNYRYKVKKYMGYIDQAQELFKKYKALKTPSELDNCKACVVSDEVDFLLRQGEIKKAWKKAGPLLQRKLSCTSQPQALISNMLVYMVDEVPQSVEMIQDSFDFVLKELYKKDDRYTEIGYFLTKTNHHRQAVLWFDRQYPSIKENKDQDEQFYYYLRSWIAVHKARRLPTLKYWNYESIGEAREDLKNKCLQIAEAFNKRNENNYYTNLIKKEFDLVNTTKDVALKLRHLNKML